MLFNFDKLKKIKIESKFFYGISNSIYRWVGGCLEGEGRPLLINSFPKSGTHLLTSIFYSVENYHYSGLHIRKEEVNKSGSAFKDYGQFELDKEKMERLIGRLKNGTYATTHLPYCAEIVDICQNNGVRILNLVRDPRAIVLSEANYIMCLRRHPLHELFAERAKNIEDAVSLVLGGFSGGEVVYPCMSKRLESYLGWMHDGAVLNKKFEQLVGSDKGGNDLIAIESIESILNYIGVNQCPREIFRESKSNSSTTLRKGQVASWRKELNEDILESMHGELNQILGLYGYA